MRQQLTAGVTTVRDLGGPGGIAVALAKAVEAGKLTGPHVLSSGRNITMTGGHGHFLGTEADSESAVRAAARAELKVGARVLEFIATGGVLTPGVAADALAMTGQVGTLTSGAWADLTVWPPEPLEQVTSCKEPTTVISETAWLAWPANTVTKFLRFG